MITGAIVLYKTDAKMVTEVIHSFFKEDDNSRILYLVDNSATNELQYLANLYPNRIIYIFGHGNIGYGAGNNIAIRKAIENKTDYHVVLNPDLKFEGDVLPKLVQFMESDSHIGLCIPDIIDYGKDTRRYCARLLPMPQNGLFRRFLGKTKLGKKLDNQYCLKYADFTKVINVPYISGCFMFFRSSVLIDIGLFDERFFMYYEDVDLSRRIHKKYKTCFYPNAKVMHIANQESYKSFKMLKIMIKSAVQYYHKYGWFFDKEGKQMNKKCLEILRMID